MPFKKGHKLAKGRPVGSKNEKTIAWEKFSDYCLNSGLEKFERELNKLTGANYVKAFSLMLEFHKPKLARTEVQVEGELNVNDVSKTGFKLTTKK